MSWFHQHQWQVTSQRYMPPPAEGFKVRGWSHDEVRELVFGVTVTGLRCTDCGAISSRRDVGDIRSSKTTALER